MPTSSSKVAMPPRVSGENETKNDSKKLAFSVGIAGGSGAGKTTLARMLIDRIGADRVAYIPHDAYYRDLGGLPRQERDQVDFDRPDSIDNDLFLDHFEEIRKGRTIQVPIYDFKSHTRMVQSRALEPKEIILVEGILTFAKAGIRDLFDIRIFIDTDADVRLIRRQRRDVAERGRTHESVIEQWEKQVRPNYKEFVEPYKCYADIVVIGESWNGFDIDGIVARIEQDLECR